MTLADIIILSLIGLAIGSSIYKLYVNRKEDGCAGCSEHSNPKWIKDYKRNL